jgi:hypothetical protein
MRKFGQDTFFSCFFFDNFLCDLFLTVKEAHLVLLQTKKIIENVVDIVLTSTCLTGCPTRQHCWLALKRSHCCCVSLGCVWLDPIAGQPSQHTLVGCVSSTVGSRRHGLCWRDPFLPLSCLRHKIQGKQVMAALVVTAQVSGCAGTQEIMPWCTNVATTVPTGTSAYIKLN